MMKELNWSSDELKSLASYMESHLDEDQWSNVYVDALRDGLSKEDMKSWYYDFYRILYWVKYEDLALELNGVHPLVVSWRLSVGK